MILGDSGHLKSSATYLSIQRIRIPIHLSQRICVYFEPLSKQRVSCRKSQISDLSSTWWHLR